MINLRPKLGGPRYNWDADIIGILGVVNITIIIGMYHRKTLSQPCPAA